MTKKNTRIAVYIQGEKYHYMTDEINLATPPWTTLEMFLLVEPTKC